MPDQGTKTGGTDASSPRDDAMFRAVLESMNDAVYVRDLGRKLIYINPAAERMTGWSLEEALAKPCYEVFGDPGQACNKLCPIDACLASGEPAHHQEGRLVRRDGAVIDARVSISPLFDDGAIVGSVVALQDLSEIQDLMRTRTQDLERVSENLGRSEERITAIVENIFEGIVTIDSAGIIQWMNRAASEMFGYGAEEITGQNIKILMPEPFKREHDTYLRRYLETGKANIIGTGREVQGRRRDGSTFPMELEIAELKLENERMFLGVTKDITERKVAEQQILDRTTELEAANAELEAFGYSVSHDLRAPLRGMDGLSQALLEDYGDSLDGVAKDYLSRISKASRRMGQMIDDILKLSRATRQEIQVLDVDLSTLAQELLSELAARDDGRAVSFKVASDISVRGDPKLLRVVLDNLLGNAWKFTGNVESAHIEFGRHWEDDVAVYFVRDNGAGFDMAFADKLFGIFQRLHSTTEFEGTGVGLATVARLVRRHGGRVWAEGRVNEGATFYFTL